MIKSFTITNYLGESIELELTRPDKSGFIVKSVEGLGPAKANINTTITATRDGTIFNSSLLNQRNITMDLEFFQTPGVSIEDIRQKSYKYFPIKRNITIRVTTDNRVSEIIGYVESNEPDIFSDKEGCNISIICPDPFFYSLKTNKTVFSGIEPAFEFAYDGEMDDHVFSNESLTDDMIEMSIIRNKQEANVFYEGDSEVGVTIGIHMIGEASNIKIYNIRTRESMSITSDFITGDTITISTVKGKKSAKLLRDGVLTNILNQIEKDSDWFTLSKGDNLFAYTAETGSNNLQFSVENKIVYDGV